MKDTSSELNFDLMLSFDFICAARLDLINLPVISSMAISVTPTHRITQPHFFFCAQPMPIQFAIRGPFACFCEIGFHFTFCFLVRGWSALAVE